MDKIIGIGEMIVLRNCGKIDPLKIDDYIKNEGYKALEKAVREMKPEEVLETVKNSGLRGRGGAAFPTGLKWSFTAKVNADQKYIVCNADEGEPGTFKDRIIMDEDPQVILEGMALTGYAVGATRGYIYVRGEYQKSIRILKQAVEQAAQKGMLGKSIFGTGFSFNIEVREGAGAYVCGEETALIESIEGRRVEPRIKPPYPGVAGLWGKPTVVNNVETLANIPRIVLKGAEWFKAIGTPNSIGTKVFSLSGDMKNKCIVEAPFGTPLRKILIDMGQGFQGRLKMVQLGGASSPCLNHEHLDVAMDYEHLSEIGATIGSGAIFAVDDGRCMVDMALALAKFFRHESCGKCTPCRIGSAQIYNILTRIASFEGKPGDLDLLTELGGYMQTASFCGLGQTAATPVMSLIKVFRSEFEAHINQKKCPFGICSTEAQKLVLAH